MSITNYFFYAIDIHLSSNVLSMTINHTGSFNQKIIYECCVGHEKLIRLTHDIKNQAATKEKRKQIRSVWCAISNQIEKHVNIYDCDNYNYFRETPTI